MLKRQVVNDNVILNKKPYHYTNLVNIIGLSDTGKDERIVIVQPGTGRIDPSPEERWDQRSEDYFQQFKSGR